MLTFIGFLIARLSRFNQKKIALEILTDFVESKDYHIDGKLAEELLSLIAKSNGNPMRSFVMDLPNVD